MSLSTLLLTVREIKSNMIKKRIVLTGEFSKKKNEILDKFDKMLKKNNGISIDIIKELFPDDNELIERVVGKENSNFSIKKRKSNQFFL